MDVSVVMASRFGLQVARPLYAASRAGALAAQTIDDAGLRGGHPVQGQRPYDQLVAQSAMSASNRPIGMSQ
jgi:hypothetical protein